MEMTLGKIAQKAFYSCNSGEDCWEKAAKAIEAEVIRRMNRDGDTFAQAQAWLAVHKKLCQEFPDWQSRTTGACEMDRVVNFIGHLKEKINELETANHNKKQCIDTFRNTKTQVDTREEVSPVGPQKDQSLIPWDFGDIMRIRKMWFRKKGWIWGEFCTVVGGWKGGLNVGDHSPSWAMLLDHWECSSDLQEWKPCGKEKQNG